MKTKRFIILLILLFALNMFSLTDKENNITDIKIIDISPSCKFDLNVVYFYYE